MLKATPVQRSNVTVDDRRAVFVAAVCTTGVGAAAEAAVPGTLLVRHVYPRYGSHVWQELHHPAGGLTGRQGGNSLLQYTHRNKQSTRKRYEQIRNCPTFQCHG